MYVYIPTYYMAKETNEYEKHTGMHVGNIIL